MAFILVVFTINAGGTGVGLGVGLAVGVGLGDDVGLGVRPGVGGGVGDGVGLGVAVGVGAAAPCTIVKVNSALWESISSVARIVWEPKGQLWLTSIVTSKVPLLSTLIAPCAAIGDCNCSAASIPRAVAALCFVSFIALRSWYASGTRLSSDRATVAPGVNPCPCRCNNAPEVTVLLPISESETAGGTRAKAIAILPEMTITAPAASTIIHRNTESWRCRVCSLRGSFRWDELRW